MIPQMPPPAPKYEWATYIEDRTPKYKYHKNRGQAYNAVMLELYGYPRGGWLYHLVGDDWIVDFEYHPPTTCSICKNSLLASSIAVMDYNVPREKKKLAHWHCKYPQHKTTSVID